MIPQLLCYNTVELDFGILSAFSCLGYHFQITFNLDKPKLYS